MADDFIYLTTSFGIAHENDSGMWLLLASVNVGDGKPFTQPVYWFSSRADAERARACLKGGVWLT